MSRYFFIGGALLFIVAAFFIPQTWTTVAILGVYFMAASAWMRGDR